jgi:4-hydroxy-3-methylbut-2-en-1-yl diphosphate reductase
MTIEIDDKSGFCFGVVHAIKAAENALSDGEPLFCLGDIVHNSMEVERLKNRGLRIIDHAEYHTLRHCRVLIRAHGEPPETYRYAEENGITLIDATCPIVLKLQQRVGRAALEMQNEGGQVVIFGKKGHAEVTGLKGQCPEKVIVIGNEKELNKIDFSRPVRFFAQTTQDIDTFGQLRDEIRRRMKPFGLTPGSFKAHDSICRQVSKRAPELSKFARMHDVIIFASDRKSSNGTLLFQVCKEANPNTYFVGSIEETDPGWVEHASTVGICGATSTPRWMMEGIKERLLAF